MRLALFAALLAACDAGTVTQVTVEIDAEERSTIDAVVVNVWAREGGARGERVLDQTFVLADERIDWPIEIALVPRGGDASRRFELRAQSTVGTHQVGLISGYVRGRHVRVPLVLPSACREVTCAELQVCVAGACVDLEERDPCSLAPGACADAGAGDAGASDGGRADAGRREAGPADAGPADAGRADADAGGRCVWRGLDDECSPPTDLATGAAHACVVRAGQVACWGDNQHGQLGDGRSGGSRSQPAIVVGVAGVEAVAAGVSHTCARTTAGRVSCWGLNTVGQVGVDGMGTFVRPAELPLTGVTDLAVGDQHACVIEESSGMPVVRCWGNGGFGRLGNGGNGNSTDAVTAMLGGTEPPTALAAGGATACAAREGRAPWCWGRNDAGQLGDGTTSLASNPPRAMVEVEALRLVALGERHGCALDVGSSAILRCWGDAEGGRVGQPGVGAVPTATPVEGTPTGVRSIAAGTDSSCAVGGAGRIWCWGSDAVGQLGDGEADSSGPAPVMVQHVAEALRVAVGDRFACAIYTDAGPHCWGLNDHGQLGGAGDESRGPSAVAEPRL